jgi:hypothetical protein
MSEENVNYHRRYLDKRIETYLDHHFHDYVVDFGILDESALDVRAERVNLLDARSVNIEKFMNDIDRDVSGLEARCDGLEKTRKKK